MNEPATTEKRDRRALPLQWVGMGLIVVFLETKPGFDYFANPVGWLFVLLGCSLLAMPERRTLVGFSAAAWLISIPLWFPSISERLVEIDPSLGWAAEDLPKLLFLIVLCRVISMSARKTDARGYSRFSTLMVLFGLSLFVPPVAFAGNLPWLLDVGSLGLWFTEIWLVWSLFTRSSRTYVAGRPRPEA